ncbi:type IV secretory system conjugative DNA transfer family protein [Kitasatospora sp. NPDC048194]|uniref:type IV secretory system conjugative DNA transfer family protein n=1 Tax=Kitasatospora sp. NPDC048194 TaxID=3364045 RepID=UPI00371A4B0D
MMSRHEHPIEPTDTDASAPEYDDGCCDGKRTALVALSTAGALPLLVGAASPAPASPGTQVPTPNMGNGVDLLTNIVANLPGHWFTVAGVAVAGLGLGYMHLKEQVSSGKARALPLPRGTGFANKGEINLSLGERQLLNRVGELRPSLARRSANALDLGAHLGTDMIWKQGLYIACEDTVLIFAPPRSGKSAWMGGQIIDAAGAAIVTSTRSDLYRLTHRLRERDGRPVFVFNTDLEGVPNTIRWNPVRGCRNPETAIDRAGYMLAGSSSGEALTNETFWNSHSFSVLRALMMAADFMGGTLIDVARWVADPDNQEPLRVLESNAALVPHGWLDTLRQEMNAPDKTAAGVYMSLAPTLQFLSVPSIAQIVQPLPGEPEFTAYELLARQGTLYLMGEDRDRGSIAPLYACLVADVYKEAKRWAKNAGGRIDPYVRFVLDEAAIICPLPLNKWTSDAGGWNIQLEISVQSYSQLEERWGVNGARTIYNNCNKFALGGLANPDDLERLSVLVGDADQTVVSVSKDKDGKPTESHSLRRIRVMPPKDVREMKVSQGLYIHRAVPPIRVQYVPTWKRKDVKLELKLAKQEARRDKREQKRLAKLPVQLDKHQPVPVPAAPVTVPTWQQPTAPAASVPVPPMPNLAPPRPTVPPAVPAPAEAPAEQPLPRASGDGGLLW